MHAHIQEVECARVLSSKQSNAKERTVQCSTALGSPESDPRAIQVPTYASCFESNSSLDGKNQRCFLKSFMITVRSDRVDNDLGWSPIQTVSRSISNYMNRIIFRKDLFIFITVRI